MYESARVSSRLKGLCIYGNVLSLDFSTEEADLTTRGMLFHKWNGFIDVMCVFVQRAGAKWNHQVTRWPSTALAW